MMEGTVFIQAHILLRFSLPRDEANVLLGAKSAHVEMFLHVQHR
jgi:hypothetical protein